MPSETERQRKFMGADLQRKREGKETKTDMSESQLEDFASKPLAKESPAPTIEVAGGTAKYLKTETEDKSGRWNDNYSTRDGYWVIHEGDKHHVYHLKPEVRKSFSERIAELEKGNLQTCKCGSRNITHNKSTGQTHCHECGRTFSDKIEKIAPLLIAGARMAGPALARAAAAGAKTAGKAAATQYGTKVGEHLADKTNQKVDSKIGKSLLDRVNDVEKASGTPSKTKQYNNLTRARAKDDLKTGHPWRYKTVADKKTGEKRKVTQ